MKNMSEFKQNFALFLKVLLNKFVLPIIYPIFFISIFMLIIRLISNHSTTEIDEMLTNSFVIFVVLVIFYIIVKIVLMFIDNDKFIYDTNLSKYQNILLFIKKIFMKPPY